MVSYKLTSDEFKSLLPYYRRCKTASVSGFSSPVSTKEFSYLVGLLQSHGFVPPTDYACSSCVLWVLKAVYSMITCADNRGSYHWYDSRGLLK